MCGADLEEIYVQIRSTYSECTVGKNIKRSAWEKENASTRSVNTTKTTFVRAHKHYKQLPFPTKPIYKFIEYMWI